METGKLDSAHDFMSRALKAIKLPECDEFVHVLSRKLGLCLLRENYLQVWRYACCIIQTCVYIFNINILVYILYKYMYILYDNMYICLYTCMFSDYSKSIRCICIYIYVYVYIYMYVYTSICMYIYTYIYIYICVSLSLHIYIYVYI